MGDVVDMVLYTRSCGAVEFQGSVTDIVGGDIVLRLCRW